MTDGGAFDEAEWSRLDRRGDRAGARALVAAAVDSGGDETLAEIAAF